MHAKTSFIVCLPQHLPSTTSKHSLPKHHVHPQVRHTMGNLNPKMWEAPLALGPTRSILCTIQQAKQKFQLNLSHSCKKKAIFHSSNFILSYMLLPKCRSVISVRASMGHFPSCWRLSQGLFENLHPAQGLPLTCHYWDSKFHFILSFPGRYTTTKANSLVEVKKRLFR